MLSTDQLAGSLRGVNRCGTDNTIWTFVDISMAHWLWRDAVELAPLDAVSKSSNQSGTYLGSMTQRPKPHRIISTCRGT